MAELKAMGKNRGKISTEEILSAIHEGHKY